MFQNGLQRMQKYELKYVFLFKTNSWYYEINGIYLKFFLIGFRIAKPNDFDTNTTTSHVYKHKFVSN